MLPRKRTAATFIDSYTVMVVCVYVYYYIRVHAIGTTPQEVKGRPRERAREREGGFDRSGQRLRQSSSCQVHIPRTYISLIDGTHMPICVNRRFFSYSLSLSLSLSTLCKSLNRKQNCPGKLYVATRQKENNVLV